MSVKTTVLFYYAYAYTRRNSPGRMACSVILV